MALEPKKIDIGAADSGIGNDAVVAAPDERASSESSSAHPERVHEELDISSSSGRLAYGSIYAERRRDQLQQHTLGKDRLITLSALGIILIAALISAYGLVWSVGSCTIDERGKQLCPQPAPAWATELIKLTLVSSLSFVMGYQQAGGRSADSD